MSDSDTGILIVKLIVRLGNLVIVVGILTALFAALFAALFNALWVLWVLWLLG